jgi:hypothetical protein
MSKAAFDADRLGLRAGGEILFTAAMYGGAMWFAYQFHLGFIGVVAAAFLVSTCLWYRDRRARTDARRKLVSREKHQAKLRAERERRWS